MGRPLSWGEWLIQVADLAQEEFEFLDLLEILKISSEISEFNF